MNYDEKLREIINSNSEYYPSEDKAVFAKYFPELKESEEERIRKTLIEYIKGIKSWNYFLGISKGQMIAWLEKQGEKKPNSQMEKCGKCQFVYTGYCNGTCILKNNEQKPANKVEPKFKVGDWVVNNVCLPMQIASIKDDMYVFIKGDAMSVLFIDGNYHLWSINDAKDGDVLVAKDDRPFIFTGEFDVQDDNPTAYCGIISSDKFITGNGSFWTFKDGIKPATKEQQDLLFAKMKEAGYEWDGNKKELKKMEIKSKNFEPKTLDADKVIAWLVANICDFEYYVKLFKKDFGL